MKKRSFFNARGFAPSLFLAAVALGAFGACFISVSVQTSSLKEFSKTWPSAPAHIIKTDMLEKDGKPEPSVEYTFNVKNRQINGSRVFLAGGSIEDAEQSDYGIRFAYRDPQGNRIEKQFFNDSDSTVYYNPHTPEENALILEVLRDMKPYFFWGVGLAVLALAFMIRCLYED